MPLDAILFDKDGTLFDFEASWADWTAGLIDELSAGNARLRAALAVRAGYDLQTRRFAPGSVAIAGTCEDVARALAPVLPAEGVAQLAARLGRAASAARMVPAVPLRPLLARLRASGLLLGLATNDAQAAAEVHLAEAGIAEAFAFVAGYDSGYGAKPGPGMCRAFAELHDLDPARVAMVGDSLHDIAAGRAAGMRTVGVLTGLATRADVAGAADAVLPDIGHLPAWIAAGAPGRGAVAGADGGAGAGAASGPNTTQSVAI